MSIGKTLLALTAPVALLSLGACATPFKADVSRFQRLPAPQGETFAIVASDPKLQGGLEFSQYASLVAQRLESVGYRAASDPSQASLIVKMDYDVDNGRERVVSEPGFGGWGGGWGGGWPYGGFYGPRRRGFIYGFNDPFLYGAGWNNQVSSYTIFSSELDMQIERRDGQRLFEGTAKAVSRDNNLTYIVPNLVDAMFTGFPGNSGETVRISIAPEKK
ncbi:DUF4136 domain-containing protein [Sphingomonas sanxanigenens]|uniref:DUF4136 domain-containing protein n=1 Tax=Sphingomonas sanxanigenens DSM 19645 = NX02 TaxID=1123269 RepID=W0A406_9SPHN|nr:DUF4136 domain-containing protein [Sphingomonas sanxanigenens]AHE51771.1 hypothetical protein NX02_00010 [Sphingomonas sanxanigenens DSM 19645 = NX02]